MTSVLAEFTLTSPVLASAFRTCPDTHLVYVQESVPDDRPAQMAFWVVGDAACFQAAMDDDGTVEDYERLATADDRSLYRVEIADSTKSKLTYDSFFDAEGVVLSTVADADGWHVRARFPNREELTRHRERCRSLGVGFTLDSVYTTSDVTGDHSGLTPPQREALVAALEMGYFEVPREATAAELGERLGITQQAVSERLRRAVSTVVERAVRDGV
jgi:hypothetical protein